MNDNQIDEDDAWSYSFPPSTDSLALDDKKNISGVEINTQQDNDDNLDVLNKGNNKHTQTDTDESKNQTITRRSAVDQFLDKDGKVKLSRTNSTSSVGSLEEGKGTKIDLLQTNGNGSYSSSLASPSLQSPFYVKSTPANPYTTKEDANSIISREGQGHGYSLESSFNAPATSSARSNLSNSIGGYDTGDMEFSNNTLGESPETDKSKSKNLEATPGSPSPKIIAYRKSKRTISEGNFQNILDQSVKTTPKEKFDPKLYVDEKFMNSEYRYATTRRTAEFHQLFRSLDLTDRLLDDFSCALSREILLQGRIYVSENNVCFSSNLLGWVTSLIIPQEDIIRIEKKSTAGLFPNGISIETANARHNFASFLSRDATFEFMKTVWQGTTGKKMEVVEEKSTERPEYSLHSNGIVSVGDECIDSPSKLESYILSIDGDEENHGENEYLLDNSDSDGTTDGRTLISKSDSSKRKKLDLIDTKIVKFKPESKYINMGPDFHPPTKARNYDKENNETSLCNETIQAPVGIVFDILFGSTNTSFHRRFLESHNASEISSYDKFHPRKDEPGVLVRNINYRRALGYSIGPKSTKCEVEETIEKLNFADDIVIVTSTVTPDVPLGNSFSVKTRYCLSWSANNSTLLRISYTIKWTGSSWIKSVIEKLTLAGQQETTQDLVDALKKEIQETTHYVEGPSVPKGVADLSTREPVISDEIPTKTDLTNEIKTEKIPLDLSLINKSIKDNFVYVVYFFFALLLLLLILQVKLIKGINEANEIAKSQLVINSYLVFTVQALANDKSISKAKYRERIKSMENDNSELWKWVNNKYGAKLNNLEKIEYLTYHLNSLYQKQMENNDFIANMEGNFDDLKKLVKDFNYQEVFNSDNLRLMLGDLL